MHHKTKACRRKDIIFYRHNLKIFFCKRIQYQYLIRMYSPLLWDKMYFNFSVKQYSTGFCGIQCLLGLIRKLFTSICVKLCTLLVRRSELVGTIILSPNAFRCSNYFSIYLISKIKILNLII